VAFIMIDMKTSPRMPTPTVRPTPPTALVRIFSIFAIFATALIAGCAGRPTTATPPASKLVILVSIDGLPASMLGDGTLPTLDRLATEGVHAEWMTASYPTLTFPNHYTLVTGLRPDRHGIIHNNMFDTQLGRYISKEDSADDGRWWGGEPIWATLQKQGGIAATMFWPGSRTEIAGERPRYSRAFDKTLTPDARVDQILSWLDLPQAQRPQLLTLYFDQYDVAAHIAGARSTLALESLRDIDDALARLRTGLIARGLASQANMVIVSDHGMADVPQANSVLLDDMLDPQYYSIDWWGTFIGIRPHGQSVDLVMRTFVGRHEHFECWRKGELPKHWRYGTHPRIPPIVCQVDVGWRVQGRQHPPQQQAIKGEHGFAPEDPAMRSVFVANGPAFQSGVVLAPFDNVDIYPLLAHLLDVKPAANDGALEPLLPGLKP
jgi:predicted AlkP superfamily pyrophosphatase or phosphodiesterase